MPLPKRTLMCRSCGRAVPQEYRPRVGPVCVPHARPYRGGYCPGSGKRGRPLPRKEVAPCSSR